MNPLVYWITGLPAAGKTTLATALAQALNQAGGRACVLDGDELRKGLCSDLGLSAADRAENIRRAGEVARLMAHNGMTVVCAFVSPFGADRQRVRALFAPGEFHEIHLSTSVEECARRDPKGLYARAKAGQITGLTGWDSAYEAPLAPESQYDTQTTPVAAMVQQLLAARTARS
ncbi:adenylyl-sulfate kinase [Acidovorax sp. A1169]|uniref:adenylyl-sulfate kinase n=1 Tax=Acidovorax sp. A1169 TaxID=3059524 RepID=UPI0027377F21|nr:adenylyl-sulfate kinase [Acidovorax sp. A1169]MDP4077777.1 adenylyl-sulfate kinase [Acidovorax sp. A1169]